MKLADITSELDNFENYTKLTIKDPFSVGTLSICTYACKLMEDQTKFSTGGSLLRPKRWNRTEETEVHKKIFFYYSI